MNTKTRKAQRQRAADENFEFYNAGVVDTEGHTVGEEPILPEAPDTSVADAEAATTALATIPIRFSVTDEQLGKLREEAKTVTFATPEGYERGRKLLFTLRSLSGAIERTRETIKAPVVKLGKRIDGTAKGLLSQVNEIRDPLQALKDNEDAERARRRQAEEDAERERLRLEQEAKLAAEREALEAQRRAFAEQQAQAAAEQARLAEEQRIAREAEAEERRQFEQQRRELAEAQAKLIADRQAVERANAELSRVAANTVESVEPVEAKPVPAAPVTQAEIDAALAENVPNMPPVSVDWVSPPAIASEAEALALFARQIRALKSPVVTSDLAGVLVEQVESMLSEAAQALESFDALEAATAAE